MVAAQQNELVVIGKGADTGEHKPDPLRCEWMRSDQVRHDLVVQETRQFDFDSHFSFTRAFRWAIRSWARVRLGRSTFQENANQFLSAIRALVTFQFRG